MVLEVVAYLDHIDRVNAGNRQNGSRTGHADLSKQTRRSSGSSGHDGVGILVQAHLVSVVVGCCM